MSSSSLLVWLLVLEFGLNILVELTGSWLLRDCHELRIQSILFLGARWGDWERHVEKPISNSLGFGIKFFSQAIRAWEDA